MIIKTEKDPACGEPQVLVRYAKLDEQVRHFLTFARTFGTQLLCRGEEGEHLVHAADIFYIESVDKKTFVYLAENVYRIDRRLYELSRDLAPLGFVQISRSCIVNSRVLESIRPLMNSRMEATLANGERLFVTRRYLNAIKLALQERRLP